MYKRQQFVEFLSYSKESAEVGIVYVELVVVPILERKKVLKIYDPEQHDYSEDKPQMVEIKPGHYVWANKAEENKYRQEYK